MSQTILQLIIGLAIGLGAGYLGAFMVLRRMSLVGDALSHVALPGIAVGFLLGVNPFLGAFAFLFVAVLGIWSLERSTELPSETLVGIFFTTALALGILLTPQPELLEALFGDIGKVVLSDLYFTLPLVAASMFVAYKIAKPLTLSILSKDLTQSMGVNVSRINFVFLLLVALIVALGIKVTGTLLMGALVIIPAAAARNVSLNFNRYSLLSSLFGGLAGLVGIFIAQVWHLTPGPMVVLMGGVIFLISFIFRP